MRALLVTIVTACVACGSDPAALEAGATRSLGMSDVSILAPLPTDPAVPVLAKLDSAAPTILPVNLVISLAIAGEIGPRTGELVTYDDFHIVAVRFDPCPRDHFAATCSEDSDDGRLRLVLQPLYTYQDKIAAHDVALHAFFPLPAADMPAIVDELRALAAIQDVAIDAPLQVSPALIADPRGAYATRLRALITKYARTDALVQLTVVGQAKAITAFEWIFAGFEKTPHGWDTIRIPTLPPGESHRQNLRVGGGDTTYEMFPTVDFPGGMATAMAGGVWATATDEERRYALEALAETENPLRHDTNDMPCMGCHVTTFLMKKRAAQFGVDPTTLARRFPTTRNVGVDSFADRDARVVRAFGWITSEPAISRRVANETANVLDELERRYP